MTVGDADTPWHPQFFSVPSLSNFCNDVYFVSIELDEKMGNFTFLHVVQSSTNVLPQTHGVYGGGPCRVDVASSRHL